MGRFLKKHLPYYRILIIGFLVGNVIGGPVMVLLLRWAELAPLSAGAAVVCSLIFGIFSAATVYPSEPSLEPTLGMAFSKTVFLFVFLLVLNVLQLALNQTSPVSNILPICLAFVVLQFVCSTVSLWLYRRRFVPSTLEIS